MKITAGVYTHMCKLAIVKLSDRLSLHTISSFLLIPFSIPTFSVELSQSLVDVNEGTSQISSQQTLLPQVYAQMLPYPRGLS